MPNTPLTLFARILVIAYCGLAALHIAGTGTASAATYSFGPHTITTAGDEVEHCTSSTTCIVYLAQGWALSTHPTYGVVAYSRVPAWGTHLDIDKAPRARRDRCATTRVARYGIVKVRTSRGCRRAARIAKILSRKTRGGVRRGHGWRCTAKRRRMVCRVRGRRVRVDKITRRQRRVELNARRDRMTRCGTADKIGTVVVWARGWQCRDVLHLGLDQAMRVGLHKGLATPPGWECRPVDSALACRTSDHSAMVVFQSAAAEWPGMRVSRDERGAVWTLRRDPFRYPGRLP